MRFSKCKNSVFCAVFLFCIFIGTICGVLLFRVFLEHNCSWPEAYFYELLYTPLKDFRLSFVVSAAPLLLVYISSFFSFRNKFLLIFIIWKGCCCSYLFCFCFYCNCYSWLFLIRQLLQLIAFYLVCYAVYLRYSLDCVRYKLLFVPAILALLFIAALL